MIWWVASIRKSKLHAKTSEAPTGGRFGLFFDSQKYGKKLTFSEGAEPQKMGLFRGFHSSKTSKIEDSQKYGF